MCSLYSGLYRVSNTGPTVTHTGESLRKNRKAVGKFIREVAADCQLSEAQVSRDETTGRISADRLRTYVAKGYLTPEEAVGTAEEAA